MIISFTWVFSVHYVINIVIQPGIYSADLVCTVADRLKSGPKIPEPGAHAQYNPIPLNVGVTCDSLLANRIAKDEEVLQLWC